MSILKKVIAGVILATFTFSHAADFTSLRETSRLVISSAEDPDKPNIRFGMGTGVVVAPNFVLTARHVVDRVNNMTFAGFSMKTRLKAFVVKLSPENESEVDLALLYVPGVQCPCVPLLEKDADVDTQLFHVGYPLHHITGVQFLNHGYVQGYSGSRNGNIMVSNVPIAPGSSGGGMYVKTPSGYKLAGIAVAVANMNTNPPQAVTWMSIIMPISVVKEFLRDTPIRSLAY